ncbi:hypothetical protein CAOG_01082 [Capsaspora owczarzaki ATCC 30864]|uniref:Uncharacterized protein n=1 Tax=Capsaspora owczarzaki (strain ATCC 30864) TaxID=595528 RepID=A0A0D2WIJ0_CAPO3|nr:hypothetical protein CAOG_01082 [Capsaspora owczarzaki ATCC 30864]KJE89645.1 hypothetical protein CAOG_001082 [Capsaspora owczarzaki ATCC 30864]|eukprot:XP_004365953.1 hypothetical protein CAOG_01082 [Capsaspora owczarzaki ATCC 30864]
MSSNQAKKGGFAATNPDRQQEIYKLMGVYQAKGMDDPVIRANWDYRNMSEFHAPRQNAVSFEIGVHGGMAKPERRASSEQLPAAQDVLTTSMGAPSLIPTGISQSSVKGSEMVPPPASLANTSKSTWQGPSTVRN